MAGRIRSIKPEILENERTARLSHEGWRLFVSLFTLADDYGNLHAAPERLTGAVFWGRAAAEPVSRLLEELAKAELVLLYIAKGQSCAHILGWYEHQRVDKPGKPKVPAPSDDDTKRSRESRETPAKVPETPANVLEGIGSGSGLEGIGGDGNRPADSEESASVVQPPLILVAPSPSPPRFDFEGVYKAHWIRKEGKADGMRICEKDIRSEGDYQQWLKAVKNYAVLMRAEGREINRQKHFSTFMACWRDYIDVVPPSNSHVINAESDAKGRQLF